MIDAIGTILIGAVTGIALATATIYTVATPPCEYVETTECKD